jgi:hypothetical protein
MALDRHSGSPTRLYPFQREIADAISDPEIERDVLTAVLTKTPNVRAGANRRRLFGAPPEREKFRIGTHYFPISGSDFAQDG